MQINNNILYEKKHRYMLVLKEINTLYVQASEEVLNNEIPAFKAKQIKDMYNQTLIGLIEEGVDYQYIQNTDNPEKDIVCITADGLNYRCKNTDLKEILKDRYEDVMGIRYAGPAVKTKTKDENDYKLPELPDKDENVNIQHYTPPAVYITPENDFSQKRRVNFFGVVKQSVITAIILGVCIFGFLMLWKNDINRQLLTDAWNKCISTLSGNQSTEQTSEDLPEEVEDIGNLQNE